MLFFLLILLLIVHVATKKISFKLDSDLKLYLYFRLLETLFFIVCGLFIWRFLRRNNCIKLPEISFDSLYIWFKLLLLYWDISYIDLIFMLILLALLFVAVLFFLMNFFVWLKSIIYIDHIYAHKYDLYLKFIAFCDNWRLTYATFRTNLAIKLTKNVLFNKCYFKNNILNFITKDQFKIPWCIDKFLIFFPLYLIISDLYYYWHIEKIFFYLPWIFIITITRKLYIFLYVERGVGHKTDGLSDEERYGLVYEEDKFNKYYLHCKSLKLLPDNKKL